MELNTIFEDDATKISAIENSNSKYITLCFTGIGHALGGIDVQREEFINASKNATTIFIVDKLRSWGNNLDFVRLANLIQDFGSTKTVNAIGNSMGGYLAIIASKFIKINNVVAFVPQFSVNKSIMPNEHRWDNYVNSIRHWVHISVEGYFQEATSYYIIAGYGGKDDMHLDLMPDSKNVHKIYLRNSRFIHNVANALKEDGILYDVIGDCFAGCKGSDIIDFRLSRDHYNAIKTSI